MDIFEAINFRGLQNGTKQEQFKQYVFIGIFVVI